MRPSHSRRGRRLALSALAVLALASCAAAASVCATTGETAPDVVTLMASTTDPAGTAWVVATDCTVESVTVASPSGQLSVLNKKVDKVVSVPTSAKHIDVTGNPISAGADFSKASNVLSVALSAIPTDPSKLSLPSDIVLLLLSGVTSSSIDGVMLPAGLQSFSIMSSNVKSLKNVQFPPALSALVVSDSKLTTLDFQIPSSLVGIQLESMTIGKFEQVALPSVLQAFDLSDNDVVTFEIRQSDLKTFKALSTFTLNVAQTSCSGSGTLETVGSTRVCVISDKEFETRYGDTAKATSASGSEGGSNAGAESTAGTTSSNSSASSKSEGSSSWTLESSSGSSSIKNGGNSFSGGGSQTMTLAPSIRSGGTSTGAPSPADDKATSSTSKSTVVVISLGCVLALVLIAVGYQTYIVRRRRKTNAADVGKYLDVETPQITSEDKSRVASSDLPVDFRDDQEISRYRIERTAVQIGKHVARGGYGVVYQGSYEGRAVAIKQMLPDGWRNDTMVADFLDEIRMCAKLDHPKIVEFIGVSWSSVRDLTIVTEYMAGGDLHSVLRQYPQSSGGEWSEPWTPSNIRSKTQIAVDVAEAVVYLHSFSIPIIHRDLKAKNVLLDKAGNAKLSDFGISREVSIDETMTSEIGTAAWIAPEVLRGERYSETADIYSLGVLLVEMDRCSHPYANEPVLHMASSLNNGSAIGENTSHIAHKNTQIAVLVSTGQLRPSPSGECPEIVAELISRCVSYDVQERPTAKEVLDALVGPGKSSVPMTF